MVDGRCIALHAMLIWLCSSFLFNIICWVYYCPTRSDGSSSAPTPTRCDLFGIRIESAVPTNRFPSSIGTHGAITIIPTHTRIDIRYRIILAILETCRRRVGGGYILSGRRSCGRAGLKVEGWEEMCSLSVSVYEGGYVR
jgi:hypothetical protein